VSFNSPYFSDTDSDSDSDSESEPDNEFDDAQDFDDAFLVDNMFDPEPHYPDSDDGEMNIFHGAHVMSVPSQYANVDLEIYEAYDEDEIEDLPEMELCIDGELYGELFNTEEAVDVEIEGSRLICTGALFEEGEEMILDDLEDDGDRFGTHEDEDRSTLESSKEDFGSQMFRQRVGAEDETSNGCLFSPWGTLLGNRLPTTKLTRIFFGRPRTDLSGD
jgi:hypothetical protein